MIKYILWDIDSTLLNFELAEKISIENGFKLFKLGQFSEELFKDYKAINRKYWRKLEKGEITKKEVLIGRYQEFFGKYGFDTSICSEFNDYYQNSLASLAVYNEFAEGIVKDFKATYKQFAVTNGTKIAQRGKLKKSGLDQLLDGIFISEEVGFEKPALEFFQKVFYHTKDYEKESYIIIGDSLTSDIQGGKNAGIKTCWFNPNKEENKSDLKPDYTIKSLSQLRDFL